MCRFDDEIATLKRILNVFMTLNYFKFQIACSFFFALARLLHRFCKKRRLDSTRDSKGNERSMGKMSPIDLVNQLIVDLTSARNGNFIF